jgi:hypothetical protein
MLGLGIDLSIGVQFSVRVSDFKPGLASRFKKLDVALSLKYLLAMSNEIITSPFSHPGS